MAEHIIFECIERGDRSYLSERNKRKYPERLVLKKYCPVERKVALHHETK